MKPTVLFLDSLPGDIREAHNKLNRAFKIISSDNILNVMEKMGSCRPHLIVIAGNLKDKTNFQACRYFKTHEITMDIPIIMTISEKDFSDMSVIKECGADDYVISPVSWSMLAQRIRICLKIKHPLADFDKPSVESSKDVTDMEDIAIIAMASLAEARDNATGGHIKRTQLYVRELANAVKDYPGYNSELTEENISIIVKSAPLHDIGKVGIPDSILLKPATLTPREYDIMKTHTVIGLHSINTVEKIFGDSNIFMRFAKEIIFSHHECWNGSGYPLSLRGDEIPVSARLMSVADVYDALISKRPYKDAYSHEEAVDIISRKRGTAFDPVIVDSFIKLERRFREISTCAENNL